ncbi:MAG: histidinol-phosphate transaminase [Acidobacteria bacterium]|nr:histidinol-phosphate transaminase [Acidobacteriota bacterium]
MVFDLNSLVRENIRELVPYSSARCEFSHDARIFLDANENAFGSPLPDDYSRYPDPLQTTVKKRIAALNNVRPSQIFLGNGSDEAIDILFRIFCRPGQDSAVICPPTYGMYEVAANINSVDVIRADLTDAFQLDLTAVREGVRDDTKLIFLCSPNNPTGNLLDREPIIELLREFKGIVIVDEAYVHFADQMSWTASIAAYPNLVVLQTFSKAWGMAGLRVGIAFANEQVIDLFNKVKPPYNVSASAQRLVLDALDRRGQVERTVEQIRNERCGLERWLSGRRSVQKVYSSDANFLLVKVENAELLYRSLIEQGIVVRSRSSIAQCGGCLRITIGTPEENQALRNALEIYETNFIY